MDSHLTARMWLQVESPVTSEIGCRQSLAPSGASRVLTPKEAGCTLRSALQEWATWQEQEPLANAQWELRLWPTDLAVSPAHAQAALHAHTGSPVGEPTGETTALVHTLITACETQNQSRAQIPHPHRLRDGLLCFEASTFGRLIHGSR